MKLKEEFDNDLVDFHSCAHGGTRDKLTTIWQSKPWFTALSLKCNKQHRHIDMNRGSRNKLMERPSFRRLKKLHIRCYFVRGSLIASTQKRE